ncbi:STM4012 family radical SAM protein [Undibacterium umbellatum]|uniref:STM4012 family radical SAM protein n=1 Tax=Undibacterium umbellatum TaxID=2762300 RepID=A0ABR6ZCI5_9BURK|nr:STM4012 family radical SAM protein [Undibacterium umbellatum]MBC3909472.1 STM4012 family radical SAM protein [Undibacterium umbellatum]
MTDVGNTFRRYLEETNRFQSYLYSYPHKTAYRAFEEKLDLKELWATEKKHALYLYTHIPFCRMKCSFCNLFTVSHPKVDLVSLYLKKIQLEAEVVRDALGDFNFAGYAIGGGTPSHLEVSQLEQLFNVYTDVLGLDLKNTPGSFEISPDTINDEKLTFLSQHGVQRLSIGIQSFIESEARSVGRVQPETMMEPLLDKISSYQFPVFNLDLIYGIPRQTAETWLESLQKAVQFQPTEIFLYPLYVRPLTSLFKKHISIQNEDIRSTLYRIGRDFLQANGYVQDSMRLFRKPVVGLCESSEYSCQEDGMIGLGTNARSYTTDVHYSTEYAVSKPNVAAIIDDYVAKERADFMTANYGIRLSEDDRKRRYLIKSLLKAQGLDGAHYQSIYGTDVYTDFPELQILLEMNLAQENAGRMQLQGEGMAYSDLIGHWFISPAVKSKMQEYVVK